MTQQQKFALEECFLTFNHGQHNEVKAIDGISLSVDEGEHIIIVGSNGAGKSTLLNLVCGRYVPDRGRVVLDGKDITNQPEHVRAKRVGRVFQNPIAGTAGPMTIAENLALAERRSTGRRLRGVGSGRTYFYQEQLSRLGMGLEDRLNNEVGSLSGGQRQALALLMASMSEPDILVLDEHTAALDPGAAERVLQLTNELIKEDGLTALMITHNMEHAVDTGDRTVMMHRGSVLFELDGQERADTTVTDLVERFRTLGATLSDRSALV